MLTISEEGGGEGLSGEEQWKGKQTLGGFQAKLRRRRPKFFFPALNLLFLGRPLLKKTLVYQSLFLCFSWLWCTKKLWYTKVFLTILEKKILKTLVYQSFFWFFRLECSKKLWYTKVCLSTRAEKTTKNTKKNFGIPKFFRGWIERKMVGQGPEKILFPKV